MLTTAKTPEQWDALQQQEAHYAVERRLKRIEQAKQEAQMDANRRALARGELTLPAVPGFGELYKATTDATKAERERIESERLAALSPRDIYRSTLSFQEQEAIRSWEGTNKGLSYPIPQGFLDAAEASKPQPVQSNRHSSRSVSGHRAVIDSILANTRV